MIDLKEKLKECSVAKYSWSEKKNMLVDRLIKEKKDIKNLKRVVWGNFFKDKVRKN